MTELTKEEKDYILALSKTYKSLHSEIGEIEGMMKNFSEKAQKLLEELESKRKEELSFLEDLSEKYGMGQIDLFSLRWKKIESDEKIEQPAGKE